MKNRVSIPSRYLASSPGGTNMGWDRGPAAYGIVEFNPHSKGAGLPSRPNFQLVCSFSSRNFARCAFPFFVGAASAAQNPYLEIMSERRE